MTFNITPDWEKTWTVKQAEEELTGFEFKGPGLYLGETGETVIAVPDSQPMSQTPGGRWYIWAQTWPDEQKFRFMFYSQDPTSSINALANAPVRRDDR